MGPILQERTTSTILNKVQVKEKVKVKHSENTAAVTSNSKTGKFIQKPQKKTSILNKNVPSLQDKETRTGTGQNSNRPKHVKSPTAGGQKTVSMPFEALPRYPRSKPSSLKPREERQKVPPQSICCLDAKQSYATQERSRRALSLPLAPYQIPLPKNIIDLESLHLKHREDDTDSASDLSDSERLPVMPSPCTPPQLNLRAEIVDPFDLHPQIPGPGTAQRENDKYGYPDFLPPPFNTWSLRQLAVLLNTEGKRAPRPKPVGHLEKYLERLLQLEWHQIQTIQAENGRSLLTMARAKGCTTAGLSRPCTAPPTRLNSPKSVRPTQRPAPFAFLPSLGSPSAYQLSRCFYCHLRYPLCNGSCSPYAYQRHSRLSPLLERKAPPIVTQKRSSSESRASAQKRAIAKAHHAVSPSSNQVHMQAAGNVRRASQELCSTSKGGNSARKGHHGKATVVESHKDGGRSAVDKHVSTGYRRETAGPEKREVKIRQSPESGGCGLKVRDGTTLGESNGFKGSQANRKQKNAQMAK